MVANYNRGYGQGLPFSACSQAAPTSYAAAGAIPTTQTMTSIAIQLKVDGSSRNSQIFCRSQLFASANQILIGATLR
jgi:hypothetical protein